MAGNKTNPNQDTMDRDVNFDAESPSDETVGSAGGSADYSDTTGNDSQDSLEDENQ